MKPKAWSFSSLDDFVNCPKAFFEKRIAKSVQEDKSEQMIWGEQVHKHFEDRLGTNVPLPPTLQEHEAYLKKIEDAPGVIFVEQQIAFDAKAKPCHFFDKEVWWRGIVDLKQVDGQKALLVDYKTGKPHNKFKQLDLFTLHTFALHPAVEVVRAEFYWTKTCTTTGRSYSRSDIAGLWKQFVPDLKQYVEAFRTGIWQPRPSGLCNGWCPVKDCEHWRPKRR
jgi:hypothetical protein